MKRLSRARRGARDGSHRRAGHGRCQPDDDPVQRNVRRALLVSRALRNGNRLQPDRARTPRLAQPRHADLHRRRDRALVRPGARTASRSLCISHSRRKMVVRGRTRSMSRPPRTQPASLPIPTSWRRLQPSTSRAAPGASRVRQVRERLQSDRSSTRRKARERSPQRSRTDKVQASATVRPRGPDGGEDLSRQSEQVSSRASSRLILPISRAVVSATSQAPALDRAVEDRPRMSLCRHLPSSRGRTTARPYRT